MNMIQIKYISTLDALDNIFCNDQFEFLKDAVIDSGEVEAYKNYYVLCRSRYHIYTDLKNKDYKWLGIYDEGELIGLQLINIQEDNVELVIAQKIKGSSVFKCILDYVYQEYNKPIITFPLNDKLKEYYMSFGFVATDDDYLIYRGVLV